MRKLATVQKIAKLEPISGADKIEKATVLGWELVVKKGDFAVGDLCVYVEIDSILPEKPWCEFMRERKYRVKTIKLRGQVSQGICFPLSILQRGKYDEGDNVTDILGVKKYDPQAELERKETERLNKITKNRMTKYFNRFKWYRKIFTKNNRLPFPAFIKKTDEDRIQLFPDICEKEKNTEFVIREKIDGQSASYYVIKNKWWKFWKPYIFGVCSRNFQLLKPDKSSYWSIANKPYSGKYFFQDIMFKNMKEYLIYSAKKNKYKEVILQGEIIGPGIQGNKYNFVDYKIFWFNLIIDGRNYSEIVSDSVPKLGKIKCLSSIKEWVEYSKGKSKIADIQREGIVCRNYEKNISFNPDFLLRYQEEDERRQEEYRKSK